MPCASWLIFRPYAWISLGARRPFVYASLVEDLSARPGAGRAKLVLGDFSALNHSDQKDHHGDDQEEMDDPAHGVRGDHAEQP